MIACGGPARQVRLKLWIFQGRCDLDGQKDGIALPLHWPRSAVHSRSTSKQRGWVGICYLILPILRDGSGHRRQGTMSNPVAQQEWASPASPHVHSTQTPTLRPHGPNPVWRSKIRRPGPTGPAQLVFAASIHHGRRCHGKKNPPARISRASTFSPDDGPHLAPARRSAKGVCNALTNTP